MIDAKPSLDDLRGEIDAIDDAIHDLLMRRADVAERIGALKDSAAPSAGGRKAPSYLRPGREALVLRRLLARHAGPFPAASLVRLWREIMASLLRLQGPFSVAVYAADAAAAQPSAYWDMARDQFGATTPMTPCQTASQVVRDVAEGRVTVGVLPFPEEGESAPWWPLLLGAGAGEPRIFARLPFVDAQPGGRAAPPAVAIARVAPEETGDDRTLIAIELAGETSRARLASALTRVGLAPLFVAARPEPGHARSELIVVEVAGFVVADDARCAKLAETLETVSRIRVLGAYAATPAQHARPRKAAARGSRRS